MSIKASNSKIAHSFCGICLCCMWYVTDAVEQSLLQ